MAEAGRVHWAQYAARAALRAGGFRDTTVATRQGRIHVYQARGRGPSGDLVIIHGLGSAASAFARTMHALRPHAQRILAPELPGHGFSEPLADPPSVDGMLEALTEALDELLDRPAVVFGNSLGGAAALRFALRRPARVKGLVLGSPGGAAMNHDELQALLGAFRVDSSRAGRALAERLFHTPPWFVPLLGGFIRRNFAQAPLRGLVNAFSPADLLTPDELGGLAMPVLLLWGRGEKLLPPRAFDWFRAHLPPHAVIEEPAGWGHCPQLERPLELAERLARFMHQVA
ncbi:MAG: alpha/beta fold hydrolase [Deltaproteobacteria bacterium]|nr:alpha/beta fold hydrolase [Deltaproteobacteria bacterium]